VTVLDSDLLGCYDKQQSYWLKSCYTHLKKSLY